MKCRQPYFNGFEKHKARWQKLKNITANNQIKSINLTHNKSA